MVIQWAAERCKYFFYQSYMTRDNREKWLRYSNYSKVRHTGQINAPPVGNVRWAVLDFGLSGLQKIACHKLSYYRYYSAVH